MKQNNMTSLNDILEQLTTEQLDEMLRAELQKEQIDDNSVRLIMRILKEREADYPNKITPEIEQAWRKYQRDAAQLEKKSSGKARGWVLRAASIAAVICLIILTFPQQAGAETFWERFFRWTESIVEFFGPKDDEARIVEYEFRTDNPGLQQVYDAVVEMGVTDPVVPMWLPEGYELMELKEISSPRRIGTHARFNNGSNEAVFEVNIHLDEKAHSYLKDDAQYTVYEQNGFTFYISNNNETRVVIWAKDNLECSLGINCQGNALDEILRSIYKWRTKE